MTSYEQRRREFEDLSERVEEYYKAPFPCKVFCGTAGDPSYVLGYDPGTGESGAYAYTAGKRSPFGFVINDPTPVMHFKPNV